MPETTRNKNVKSQNAHAGQRALEPELVEANAVLRAEEERVFHALAGAELDGRGPARRLQQCR